MRARTFFVLLNFSSPTTHDVTTMSIKYVYILRVYNIFIYTVPPKNTQKNFPHLTIMSPKINKEGKKKSEGAVR